ncbi:MAG: hypothetical protein J6P66_05910 [Bacteroidaceae bacterium]|nr:hypothetical protein [Bacteroidaceae bacterium]
MKIAIEINLKKLAIIAGMVLATYIGCRTGMGDALVVIIPAGLYGLVSKEV